MTNESASHFRSWYIIGALLAWVAVALQFYLLITNRVTSVPEAVIRFFSFFTILTNTLVAIYFTTLAGRDSKVRRFFSLPETGTAVTSFILFVGLSYQILLRHIWAPQGLQWIVDELLHTIIPAFVLMYWIVVVDKKTLRMQKLWPWLLYPLIYFIVVLIRGSISGYYPYYFIDVAKLGIQTVLINSALMMVVFLFLLVLMVYLPRVGAGTPPKKQN